MILRCTYMLPFFSVVWHSAVTVRTYCWSSNHPLSLSGGIFIWYDSFLSPKTGTRYLELPVLYLFSSLLCQKSPLLGNYLITNASIAPLHAETVSAASSFVQILLSYNLYFSRTATGEQMAWTTLALPRFELLPSLDGLLQVPWLPGARPCDGSAQSDSSRSSVISIVPAVWLLNGVSPSVGQMARYRPFAVLPAVITSILPTVFPWWPGYGELP